jgi:hypothetical protein
MARPSGKNRPRVGIEGTLQDAGRWPKGEFMLQLIWRSGGANVEESRAQLAEICDRIRLTILSNAKHASGAPKPERKFSRLTMRERNMPIGGARLYMAGPE